MGEEKREFELSDTQEALAMLGVYALEQKDLEAILSRAIDITCIILNLDCAVIYAFNEEDETLQIEAQAGCAASIDPLEVNDKWDIGYAIRQEEPTVVECYDEDDRFAISPYLADQNVTSSINIVVRGTNDTFGLLCFYSESERKFTDDEINFLQIVANMIGMAIERDLDKKDLKQRNEELKEEMKRSRKFQREILHNSVSQRWELGSFLHDDLAQLMVSAKITVGDIRKKIEDVESELQVSQELSQLNKIIDDGISGIRDLTQYIIPIDLEKEGVAHAYRFLMKQTKKIYDINCKLQTGQIIHDIKNIEVATNLYHIIQEAVKNAAVHGDADNVIVTITKPDGVFVVKIEDDGDGFSNTKNGKEGRGIRIMRHRMELMGGTFNIEEFSDATLSGTIITCTIPIEYATTADGSGKREAELMQTNQ